MRASITGSTMPVLEMQIAPGERLLAETGELSWKSGNVQLRTTTAAAGSSGFFGAIGRALSGGGVFMTEYTTDNQMGVVAFAAKIPGHIVEHQIAPGSEYLVHRHGFLCCTDGVTLSAGFQQSLGTGLFGGNGFIMQKVSGQGTAWFELGGEVVPVTLAPGQVIDVHPGHVGMFDSNMRYEITTVPGIKNKIFGGDGIFLVRLTGPGNVWLQTLTLPNLAHALGPYIGGGEKPGANTSVGGLAAAGLAGSLVSKLFEE